MKLLRFYFSYSNSNAEIWDQVSIITYLTTYSFLAFLRPRPRLGFVIPWKNQLGPNHKVFRYFICFIFHVSMLTTTNVLVQHFLDQGSFCIFIIIQMDIHCVPLVWRCYDNVFLILVTIYFLNLDAHVARSSAGTI